MPQKRDLKPQTSVNWAGHPYRPELGEDYYGGPSKQEVNVQRLVKAREKLAKTPMSASRLRQLRAAAAYARDRMRAKRAVDKQSPAPSSKGLSSNALSDDGATH
jgi:hypothetical protein